MNAGTPLLRRLLVLGGILAAFAVRCSNLPSAFVDGRLFPFDSDPAYHLRKIWLLIHNFPRIPTEDPFLAYPHAAQVQWPPLFDLAFAALHLPFGRLGPARFEALLAFLIPALGAATAGLAYLAGRRLFGERAGIVALFLVALSPGHTFITILGRIDHHLVEPVFLLLLVPLAARFPSWPAIVGVALAIVGLVLSIPLTYYPSLVYVTAAVVLWSLRSGERAVARSSFAAWSIVTLVSAGFSFSGLWERFEPWDVQIPGRFWFAFSLTNTALLGAVVSFRRDSRRGAVGAVVAVGAALALAALLVRKGAPAFLARAVSREDAHFALQGETENLFTMGLRGYAEYAWSYLTPLWVVAAAAVVTLLRGGAGFARFLFGVILAGLLVQSLVAARFVAVASVPIALAAAWVATDRALRPWLRRSAVLCALLSVIPSAQMVWRLRGEEVHYPTELMRSLLWLRDRTPPAAPHPWDPALDPEYGVVSNTAFGGFLAHYAERPTLDSPFDTDRTHAGRLAALRIRLATDETEAWREIEKSRVRYVLSYPDFAEYPVLQKILGLPGEAPSADRLDATNVTYVATRLHILDGSSATFDGRLIIPALSHFRLVYRTPEERRLFGRPFPSFKVFECVRGARVVLGRPLPKPGRISIGISDREGRRSVYSADVAAGIREVVVPYSTGYDNGFVRTGDTYLLKIDASERRFPVPEEAVVSGREIRLRPIQAAATASTNPASEIPAPSRRPGG